MVFVLIFSFPCSALLIVVFPFVLFLLAIMLSILQLTVSDYPFGSIKLSVIEKEVYANM